MAKNLYSFIREVNVSCLITNILVTKCGEIQKECKINLKVIPLNKKNVELLGDFLMPWYITNWTDGSHYRVAEWTKKVKLEKGRPIKITVAQDCDSNQKIIVDGAHRAVAVYQNRYNFIPEGEIAILKSPYIRTIFPSEFYSFWAKKGV